MLTPLVLFPLKVYINTRATCKKCLNSATGLHMKLKSSGIMST